MADEQASGGVVDGAQMVPTPRFWGTNLSVLGTTNEVVVLFGSSAAALNPDGTVGAAMSPVAQVAMPPVVAKELIVLLEGFIRNVESQVGELTSPFLKQNAGK